MCQFDTKKLKAVVFLQNSVTSEVLQSAAEEIQFIKQLEALFAIEDHVGIAPFTVTFQDNSISTDSTEIISWEWDFNNDRIVDATEQNPVWEYDSLGTYSVGLKVSTGNSNSERIKNDLITLIRKPGIPIIDTISHSFIDTTIERGSEIFFNASASDTTEYVVNYLWYLNSRIVDRDSAYKYRAFSFPTLHLLSSLFDPSSLNGETAR